MSRWERCRTGVVLRVLCSSIQQHMACQRAARLVMVISLPAHLLALLRSAWLLCFLPPCSPSPPHDVVVKRRRGRGSHVPPERSAHKCVHPHALHAAWVTQQRVAHELAGIPPFTPQHEDGAWCHHTQAWQVCVVVELVRATGRHAWRGSHGQLHSCSAWFPPVPCHHKNERK